MTTITRRQFITASAAAATLAVARTAYASNVHVDTGPAFGSAWRLVLASPGAAPAARRAVQATVARIDRLMSPFRAGSELARFNASDGRAMVLNAETAQVTDMALRLARASGGAFDPTTAPIGRRFGFGPPAISATRPAGCHGALDLDGRTLSASAPGVSLDLCAVAKGHALDAMVAALDGLDFVLELGGEVAARGRHPSGRAWRFGIERPGSAALQRVIDAGGDVLATSGNAVQGYGYRGHAYGHVVDPRRSRPVDNGVVSVSVLAPGGAWADGLATAALVLGPKAAPRLLAAHGARALFLVRDGAGLREIDVHGFLKGAAG